jgi:hypothetical protein
VGAVEEPEAARCGDLPADAPEEVVGQLLLGGLFPNDAARTQAGLTSPPTCSTTPPLPEASMPCSTTSTDGCPAGGLGVQRVQQAVDPLAQPGELLRGALLVARADRVVARVDRGGPLRRDAERFAR